MRRRRYAPALWLCLAVLTVACGSGSESTPTAPAPTSGTTVPGNIAIDLTVLTPVGTVGAGVTAPVVGIVAQISGACPNLTFVLSGVTVRLSNKTVFDGGACADVKEGMRAGALGTRGADGSVDAERVKMGPPPPQPVTGVVKALSGSCPSLTFVLEGVTVHTSVKTVFEGGTCADVKEDMRAGAIGPKAADGSVDAEHVKMAAAPTPPPTGGMATGPVASLTGTCPSVTFALSGTTIHTSDKTVFEGGACADLKEGMRAGAIGVRRADGSVDAERVKMAAAPTPPPTGGMATGRVASLTGTCPSVTFVLSGTTIHTNDKTVFDGGACGDLKDGVQAGAIGQKRSDGSIDAERVRIPKT